MKVFITGGTGFVGSTLTRVLAADGHEVTLLTRSIRKDAALPEGVRYLEGDPTRRGPWQEKVPEHAIFINLAGASIFTRWNEKTKREMYESRILTTNRLVEAMAGGRGKDMQLLSTSAVGFYGFHGDEPLEEPSPPGSDFLASLAADWEAAASAARGHGVRVVLCRFGIVLGREGGVLKKQVPLFRRFLGAPVGDGNQWMSWIHESDLANIFLFFIDREKTFDGAVNCTAPEPVRNRDFTRTLGEVLGVPTLPAVPGFLIRLILGEFGGVILKGQRVLPRKLLELGYRFQFPSLREALVDLLR